MRDAASELGTRRPLYTQYRGDHYTEPATHFEQLSTVTHTYHSVPKLSRKNLNLMGTLQRVFTFQWKPFYLHSRPICLLHLLSSHLPFPQSPTPPLFPFCFLFQSLTSFIQSSHVSACFYFSSQESLRVCKPTPVKNWISI